MDEGREPEKKGDLPQFTWLDVLALSIAAFQVILPVVLLFFGALVVVYLVFRLLFR